MRLVFAAIAVFLAWSTVPSAATAKDEPRPAFGVALQSQDNRVLVAEVRPGGTGDLLGIRAGDEITHAGGKPIDSPAKLTAFIRSLKIGDALAITVRRDGESLRLSGTAMAAR